MRRLTAIQPLMALKGRFLIDATAGPDPLLSFEIRKADVQRGVR